MFHVQAAREVIQRPSLFSLIEMQVIPFQQPLCHFIVKHNIQNPYHCADEQHNDLAFGVKVTCSEKIVQRMKGSHGKDRLCFVPYGADPPTRQDQHQKEDQI